MLQRICLCLSICALAFFLGAGLSSAGWNRLGLTSAQDASSLVISIKKNKHHDDDDDNDNDDDHHQGNKKHNDEDSGLESCTIQSSKGGGGCVAPLKYVCEKLKNGKKCCGCVGDKNAKTQTPQTQTQQPPEKKPGSYCSEVVAASMEGLARQTCANNHPGSWMNCAIITAGPEGTIKCCCNWLE
jgi:hypothetical protein